MDATALRALQAPLKEKYKQDASAARYTIRARGEVDIAKIGCGVERIVATSLAGLHPACGGTGEELCSADMLLQALVACAGVTLASVATAMSIPVDRATVLAEGELDFRGTLGIDKTVPVGFSSIRLVLELVTSAPQDKLDTLLKLTERYCVVLQTLQNKPELGAVIRRG